MELSIIRFWEYQDENLKLVSHHLDRAWSDCMDVHAGLALYWFAKANNFWLQQDKG